MHIESYLTPCTKINSEWVKDYSIRSDKLDMIEEKVGNSLELIGTEDFLNKTLQQMLRPLINKMELLKTKDLLQDKGYHH